MGCQPERKRGPVALDELTRWGERRRDLLLALRTPAGQPDLQEQELVEGEAATALLGLLQRTGPVQGDERVGAQRKPFASSEQGWQRIGNVSSTRQHLL